VTFERFQGDVGSFSSLPLAPHSSRLLLVRQFWDPILFLSAICSPFTASSGVLEE
jgi:hypothetical protein